MCTTLTNPGRSGIAVIGGYGGVVYAMHHYFISCEFLPATLVKQPDIIDEERTERGEGKRKRIRRLYTSGRSHDSDLGQAWKVSVGHSTQQGRFQRPEKSSSSSTVAPYHPSRTPAFEWVHGSSASASPPASASQQVADVEQYRDRSRS